VLIQRFRTQGSVGSAQAPTASTSAPLAHGEPSQPAPARTDFSTHNATQTSAEEDDEEDDHLTTSPIPASSALKIRFPLPPEPRTDKVDKFDPEAKDADARIWLNMFCRAKDGLRPAKLCDKLLAHMAGRAKFWADQYAQQKFSDERWPTLQDEFLQEFMPFENEQALHKLRARTFAPEKESLERYFADIEMNFARIHRLEIGLARKPSGAKLQQILDVQLRDCLAAGLPSELADILRQHKNVVKAKRLALQKELSLKEDRRRRVSSVQTPAVSAISATAPAAATAPPTPAPAYFYPPVPNFTPFPPQFNPQMCPPQFIMQATPQSTPQPQQQLNPRRFSRLQCYNCGQTGHKQINCPFRAQAPSPQVIQVVRTDKQGNLHDPASQGQSPGQ